LSRKTVISDRKRGGGSSPSKKGDKNESRFLPSRRVCYRYCVMDPQKKKKKKTNSPQKNGGIQGEARAEPAGKFEKKERTVRLGINKKGGSRRMRGGPEIKTPTSIKTIFRTTPTLPAETGTPGSPPPILIGSREGGEKGEGQKEIEKKKKLGGERKRMVGVVP